MTFEFNDKQTVDLWFDDCGNFLRARPRPWTSAQRSSPLGHADGGKRGPSAVSASSNSSPIIPLVMVTTAGAGRPQSGYLLPATPSKSSACPCLKVTLPQGGTGRVKITLGLVTDGILEQGMIAVATKQTKQQDWLQEIWQAAHALQDEQSGAKQLGPVTTLSALDCSALEGLDKQRLVIMLLWQHWIDSKATDEAKIADLKELGLPGASDRGAMWTIVNRMELKLCQVPAF